MKEFYRYGALVFGGLIIGSVLTYVYYATVTRSLGVEETGLFMSLVSAIMIGSLPAAVGGNVIAKMAADACGRGQQGVVAALSAYSFWLIVPLSLVVAFGLAFGIPYLAAFFHADDTIALILAGISFATTFVLIPQRAVFQGAGRFTTFVASNVIEGVGKGAAGFACWALHGGMHFALGGYIVASIAAIGFNAARSRNGPPKQSLHLPRALVLRHLIGIALPTAAVSIVAFADVVLVRHTLDAYNSGLYSATALFGRAVLAALAFVPLVLMPRTAAERAAGRPTMRLLLAAAGVTTLAVTAALIAATLFPRILLTAVAGRAFVPAAPLLLPYTAAMGALVAATVLSAYLFALDRTAFAIPMIVVAVCEVSAIAIHHPDALTIVHIVLAGHCAIFLCCLVDVLFAIRQEPSQKEASVRPNRR